VTKIYDISITRLFYALCAKKALWLKFVGLYSDAAQCDTSVNYQDPSGKLDGHTWE
jgi:hypothetical protein